MPTDSRGRDNPLGPRAILSTYHRMLGAVEAGRADALLVATQEQLDLTGIDAGLAVTVSAQQRELKRQSRNFTELVEPDYIALVAALDNLLGLLNAIEASYRKPAADPNAQWSDVTEMLGAVGETAGETLATADSAVDHLNEITADVARISARLDAVITLAQSSLSAQAKKSLDRVEKLTAEISGNIQAIVDGAQATGDAFTDFGVGLLTTITDAFAGGGNDKGDDEGAEEGDGKGKDEPDESGPAGEGEDALPDGDDSVASDVDHAPHLLGAQDKADLEEAAATKNSDGGVPDVTFAVQAIKAGFKGTEKYVGALKGLQANNELLAAEYQKIAAFDRLIAVASATRAQKDMYVSSAERAQTAVTAIRDGWGVLQDAYLDWADRTDDSRDEFARLYADAMPQWKKLAPEVSRIKRHLVHVGVPTLI